jgi:glutamate-5-semialdehyde dehydrogenase
MFTQGISHAQYERIDKQLASARLAARVLATKSTEEKNKALDLMTDMLLQRQDVILTANSIDVEQAVSRNMAKSFIDRLTLTPARIQDIAQGLQSIRCQDDPVGKTLEQWQLSNGLLIEKRSVPLGVIAIIYEARPNVTADAAALALKTSNVVILRGSADALLSNRAITEALRQGLRLGDFPIDAIQLVDVVEHEAVNYLVRQKDWLDLVIPRGGPALIRAVVEQSLVPIIETGIGNCHIYVDYSADLEMATNLILNAKMQRPSVCNAVETLLVHEAIAPQWFPTILPLLRGHGVEIRGCEKTQAMFPDILHAQESDWSTEFLDLILAVKVVPGLQDAIEHIEKYGTRHTETIVTKDRYSAEQFQKQVDAAAVFHNASSRLTDGFVFGFGAEIGISTQKLHARGPVGLKDLTSYKYIGHGHGQIRV